MPQFILDHGSREGTLKFQALSSFAQGYVEAMFFTETGTGDDAEQDLECASVDELSPEAWRKIIEDCRAFKAANEADLDLAYETEGYDEERAGNDFWYTRNRHGVGFWDRDLGEVGERLTTAANHWRSLDLVRGDDGLLYLEG